MSGLILPHHGIMMGGGPPAPTQLTVTKISEDEYGSSTPWTLSSLDFGAASADRYVVVTAGGDGGSKRTFDYCDVGGTVLTRRVTSVNNNNPSAVFSGLVTTGTTMDVSLEATGSISNGIAVGVYTVLGDASPTISDTDNGTSFETFTMTVGVGGAIFCAGGSGGVSGLEFAWSTPSWRDSNFAASTPNACVAYDEVGTDNYGGSVNIEYKRSSGSPGNRTWAAMALNFSPT